MFIDWNKWSFEWWSLKLEENISVCWLEHLRWTSHWNSSSELSSSSSWCETEEELVLSKGVDLWTSPSNINNLTLCKPTPLQNKFKKITYWCKEFTFTWKGRKQTFSISSRSEGFSLKCCIAFSLPWPSLKQRHKTQMHISQSVSTRCLEFSVLETTPLVFVAVPRTLLHNNLHDFSAIKNTSLQVLGLS